MPVHHPAPHDRPSRHRPKAAGPLPGDRRLGHPGSTAADLAILCQKLASMDAATEENLLRYGYTPEQLKTLMPEARKILGPTVEVVHG